jgi:hypothetical protein
MNHAKSFSKASVSCFVLLTFLSGCAKDYSISPQADGEKVTITIKPPDELEPEVMRVMSRSAKCLRITHDGDGRAETIEGHNAFEVSLHHDGADNLYWTDLFVDGGGACEWRLSKVVFGVTYRVLNLFGENVLTGAGGEIVVVFDHNDPQLRLPGAKTVFGRDLKILKDYYPWVNERFTDGYVKRASLCAENGGDITYIAREARNITFEPVLHPDYVVTSIAPKKHAFGEYIRFYYPDGTIESDGRSVPTFTKMQKIRMTA